MLKLLKIGKKWNARFGTKIYDLVFECDRIAQVKADELPQAIHEYLESSQELIVEKPINMPEAWQQLESKYGYSATTLEEANGGFRHIDDPDIDDAIVTNNQWLYNAYCCTYPKVQASMVMEKVI